jgi:hypothetical protein
MLMADESSFLFFFVLIQILGLLSLAGARLAETSRWHRFFRGAFLLCLTGVGVATMLAVGCHSGWWICCSATLAIMAVGSVFDLGRTTPAPAY